ncbi:hypothetical protein CA267_007895 [Alteromonas pelagimontana]|uniref:Phytanoyl-CoA dioxygenase family protein n=1 Tax=Alteromonas pelagimontana TaxID=1858656 RepID=A0A6M4MEV5_9ALTE|nr:hypothetical protein [Alteromonas pelagimontana]QJR80706.1 hypothetical protein CA267_007895 [Alteromonas pelagimontana]
MEVTVDVEDKASAYSKKAYLLNKLRKVAYRYKLIKRVHQARHILHFGPWRVLPIKLIRLINKPEFQDARASDSLLPEITQDSTQRALVEKLQKDGVAIAGVLPAATVAELTQVTRNLPPYEYQLVHQVCPQINRIVTDEGIKNVVRGYLKSEPVLLAASLFVTHSEDDEKVRSQNKFHFDYAGWESLNVFVYITPVSLQSSYHVAIKGSHKEIGLKDMLVGEITEAEARKRFGDNIENITGPAGTVFFENVEMFHRRHKGNERRILLNLIYASHRNLFSYGRASAQQLAKRDECFHQSSQINFIKSA